jgi:hypothetical protein
MRQNATNAAKTPTNWAANCRAHPDDGKFGMEDCTSLESTMTSFVINDDSIKNAHPKKAPQWV